VVHPWQGLGVPRHAPGVRDEANIEVRKCHEHYKHEHVALEVYVAADAADARTVPNRPATVIVPARTRRTVKKGGKGHARMNAKEISVVSIVQYHACM
jgi:hypothetical protein